MKKHVETAAFNCVERLVGAFATDGRRPFHDQSSFPWTRVFAEHHGAIRREAEALYAERDRIPYVETINPQQRTIVDDRKWKTFFFQAFGHRLEENMKRCPETASVLQHVPNLVMAFFSFLEPGTTLKPHRGIYRGVLRYHLGVNIPVTSKPCGLSVAGEYRPWTNGSGFVFDDTFEHFAQNESDEPRVVLIVDFERELPFWLRGVNSAVISAIGRSDFIKHSIGLVNGTSPSAPEGKSIY